MFMVGITKNLESVLRKTLFGVLEKNLMTMHEQLVKFQYVELMVDFLPKETTLESICTLIRQDV